MRADAPSRNEITRFLEACPGADQKAAGILYQWTNNPTAWMSPDWIKLFTASIRGLSAIHIESICSRKEKQ